MNALQETDRKRIHKMLRKLGCPYVLVVATDSSDSSTTFDSVTNIDQPLGLLARFLLAVPANDQESNK